PWTSDPGDRWGWRAPVVLILVVISLVALSTAVTLGWSRTTLISTDGYVDALVEPLASDPDVKDAVATELAREMTANMGGNIADQLTQWVPADATIVRASLETFAAQIEEGWRNGLKPAIRAQLDQPTFHELWVDANREAHRQLIAALRDGTTGATVTLD